MREFTKKHLNSFGINPSIIDRYDEPHRFYHNWDHIENLLRQLGEPDGDANSRYTILFFATIFHDLVYDPRRSDNEIESAKLMEQMCYKASCLTTGTIREISDIIIDTKDHKPRTELSKVFCNMDLRILNAPLDELIEYENKIFKEFQFVDWKTYKIERIKVLMDLIKTLSQVENTVWKPQNLLNLISYIEAKKPSIAIYPGSFNPFHVGHYNILQKAEKIFDKVIIARGVNPDKIRFQNIVPLKILPEALDFHQTEVYTGLLTDFINKLGYDVTVIRGLRNGYDLQYEMNQYRFLQDLKPDIKIVSLFCDKEFEHVSSSAIRQLETFGKHHSYLLS